MSCNFLNSGHVIYLFWCNQKFSFQFRWFSCYIEFFDWITNARYFIFTSSKGISSSQVVSLSISPLTSSILALRTQNIFFSWNKKITLFFYIKVWKNHIWIYISNFNFFFLEIVFDCIFHIWWSFSLKLQRYENFKFTFFFLPNICQFS